MRRPQTHSGSARTPWRAPGRPPRPPAAPRRPRRGESESSREGVRSRAVPELVKYQVAGGQAAAVGDIKGPQAAARPGLRPNAAHRVVIQPKVEFPFIDSKSRRHVDQGACQQNAEYGGSQDMQCGFEQRAQERGLQNTYRRKPERSAPKLRGRRQKLGTECPSRLPN